MNIKVNDGYSIPTIKECLTLFSRKDKQKIFLVTSIQVFLGVLDLMSIVIIGVLTSIAINGLQSRPAGNRVTAVIEFFNLQQSSLQAQATILGVVAAVFLIAKTFVSIYLTRRILFFLGRKSAHISKLLLAQIYKGDVLSTQLKSQQELVFAVTGGVNAMTVSVIGTLTLLVSDSALVMVLGIGLFILDPITAILSLLIFIFLAIILYYILKTRATQLGSKQSSLMIEVNERLLQSIASYRELRVHHQLDRFVSNIFRSRLRLSDVSAEMNFLPNISKYVLEIAIVIAAITVSAVLFTSTDAARAISVLAIFLAASSRLAPAILRIQQGLTAIRTSLANATLTMYFIRRFGIKFLELDSDSIVTFDYSGFSPKIEVRDLSFTYPGQPYRTVSDINLDVPEGAMIALVGPSGSGKSTLVDLILGVLIPQSGQVKISNMDPKEAFSIWPGAVSYVPQQINLVNGSILENVIFSSHGEDVSEHRVWKALQIAQLEEFVTNLPGGLGAQVGDKGSNLSGGQRQRIGLARALYSDPLILVLDEATSALDSETEARFADALKQMKGRSTLLVIAHRIATVRDADKVIYLDEGRIRAIGSFSEVKELVPDFALQAKLLGL
jgi:ABC-type multidrug transport system fused ATPase/permease subunit